MSDGCSLSCTPPATSASNVDGSANVGFAPFECVDSRWVVDDAVDKVMSNLVDVDIEGEASVGDDDEAAADTRSFCPTSRVS